MTEEVSHAGSSIQLDNDHVTDQKRAQATLESFVFPASVSALQSHVVASTPEPIGIWAYVAGDTLVVVRPAEPPRKWPRFTLLDGSGWSKYTSLSFCQELVCSAWPIPDSPMVTASEGGIVRIWNIEKNATVKFHEQHWGRQTIVEWSPRNSNLIYAMDVQGQLSVWDVKLNVLTHANFGKIRASCIAVSPHENDVMAVGTLEGDVYILDTSGVGAIIHKMRHAEQVYSISWKPAGIWATLPALKKFSYPYLASSIASMKPPSVMIWDRQGKEVAKLIPWEFDSKDRKLVMSYVPMLWLVHPRTNQIGLVSCGSDGDVIIWAEVRDQNPQKLFSLNSNYVVSAFVQCGDILWTLTQEHVAMGWNLETEKIECIIPTYNRIATIQASPSELSRIAIGGLDGMIRVVKMGAEYPNNNSTDYELPVISHKLKGRITALAWHPRSEKIAFGTEDGLLGVFECKMDTRFTMVFDRRIHGTVYTIDWGAHTYTEGYQVRERKDDENEKPEPLWIYACGNRTVSMIHPSRRTNALVSTMKTICVSNPTFSSAYASAGASDIKWSPDKLYLAIGFSDGKIEVYQAPYLKLRCWIKCHAGGIQYLAWRPQDFEGDVGVVKNVWFASCCNDATAKIFNLSKLYDPDFLVDPCSEIIRRISSDGILIGHGGLRVISLAWSPHDDNLLLTTSYDRTAVVWNIETRTRIARYVGHEHRLVAGIFHPKDPYKVITSSDEMTSDSCLHIWDYRNHPEKANYDQEKGCESMSGEMVESVKAQAAPITKVLFRHGGDGSGDGPVTQGDEETAPKELVAEKKLITKLVKSSTLFPMANRTYERNTFLDELKYIIDKIPIPTQLNENSKAQIAEENSVPKIIDDEHSFLVQLLYSANIKFTDEDLENDPVLHLAILDSKNEARRMVQKQVDEYKRKEDWTSLGNLSEYVEDPKSIIETVLKANHVDGNILRSARKYSKQLSEEATRAYVTELLESDKIQQAVSTLLLSDSPEEAIDILLNNKLYWDALILAKIRDLPIKEILEKWINFLKEEQAAEFSELLSQLKMLFIENFGPDPASVEVLA